MLYKVLPQRLFIDVSMQVDWQQQGNGKDNQGKKGEVHRGSGAGVFEIAGILLYQAMTFDSIV
ncbi:hypothetical protein OAH05_02680 [bacterium]|nr:hypothetical protein [bacterium]